MSFAHNVNMKNETLTYWRILHFIQATCCGTLTQSGMEVAVVVVFVCTSGNKSIILLLLNTFYHKYCATFEVASVTE